MKLKTRLQMAAVATLAISVLIILVIGSLLRNLDREAENRRVYHEIRLKTLELGQLTAGLLGEPSPGRVHQIRAVRSSLDALLGTLVPSDARGHYFLRQIRANSLEIDKSLTWMIAISQAPGSAAEAERFETHNSHLLMKTQFIVDDTHHLDEISGARMASSRKAAILLAFVLIVGLLAVDAAIIFVTGRKIVRAQESLTGALAKAEEGDRLLSAFMEYVPERVVIADAAMRPTMVSAEGRDGIDFPGAAGAGDGAAVRGKVFHADGETPMAFEELPLVRAVQGGEVVREAEIVQVGARGERMSLLCSAGPIRDGAGRIVGGVAVSRDISARRQAEEAFRRLSQFPEQNPYPVMRCTLDGSLLYANAASIQWLAALGWRAGTSVPEALREVVLDAGKANDSVAAEITDTERRTFGITAIRPPGEPYVNLYAADLTARKQASQALAASEKRYRELLDTANSIILRVSNRGTIGFINEFGLRFLGYKAEELLGREVTILVPKIEAETGRDLEALVREVFVHPDQHTYMTNQNIRKDGRIVWVAWTNKAILDERGDVLEILAIGNDITALKEAEATVRASEEAVRRKLESVLSPEGDLGALSLPDFIDLPALQSIMDDFYAIAGIPMAIIDPEGRVLLGVGWQDICVRFHRVHPATSRNCLESDTFLSAGLAQGECRLYKCKNDLWDMATPVFVAGKHVGNIFTGQFFFADEAVDRESFRAKAWGLGFDVDEYLAALDRVPRLSRETVDRGISFLRKLADMLSQHGFSNAKLARLLAERDRLTDSLRESRAKLDAALNSMTDAVFISDAEGRFIHVNDAFATFHRFRSRDECAGSFDELPRLLDIFMDSGEPAPAEMEAVPRALRGETASNAEYTLRRKDTGESWVGSYSFGPIRDEGGAIVGSVVVCRDITERKRAEEALRANEERLRDLLGEKEVLMKEVHHRVKNNLQVISSLVALQADTVEDPSVRSIIQDVIHRVRSIAIVHEKLYQTADLSRIEFSEYAESLLDYLWRSLRAGVSGIRLSRDFEPIWLSVNAAVPCGLILNELVSNALKHAFPGRTDGEILVSLRGDGQGEVTMSVRDDGVGLPAGFDMGQCRSLGLRLVHMLSKQLHADVRIESGAGTGFTITFGGSGA